MNDLQIFDIVVLCVVGLAVLLMVVQKFVQDPKTKAMMGQASNVCFVLGVVGIAVRNFLKSDGVTEFEGFTFDTQKEIAAEKKQ